MANRLTKIYSRVGDDGSTGLADGSRIDKSGDRIDAIGQVDELNSLIGVLIEIGIADDIAGYLQAIQQRLFDIGGELAIPGSVIIKPDCTRQLEEWLDACNKELPALKEFILPGGSLAGGVCHLARSVCRRVERSLVRLERDQGLNSDTLCYINRLSDLLFVLARVITLQAGGREVFWNSKRLKRPE